LDKKWKKLRQDFSNQPHFIVRERSLNSFEIQSCEQDRGNVIVETLKGRILAYKASEEIDWQEKPPIHDRTRYSLGGIDTMKYVILSLFFAQDRITVGYEIKGNYIIPLLKVSCDIMEVSNIKKRRYDRRLTNTDLQMDLLESVFSSIFGGVIQQKIGDNGYRYVNRNDVTIEGFGFEPDYHLSKRKALLEYIERLCSSIKPKEVSIDSFANLDERAISPILFGTYPDEVLQESRLNRCTDDLVLEWIRAESVFNNNEVYIPLQVTHYLIKDVMHRYIYENSNGCAIGNSLIESRLYSLLEVIERESFLQCWYKKEGFQEIDLDVFACNYIRAFKELFLSEGYQLQVYMLENAFHIPVVWAFVENIDGKGFFYSLTALGANVEIYSALKSALHELHLSFMGLKENPEGSKKRIKEFELNPTIKNVEGHIYFFASKSVKPLFMDIKKRAKKIEAAEVFKNDFTNIDVNVEYNHVLRKIKETRKYRDLLFVDLTLDEMKPFSLFCSKAVLLGAIPLDFTQKFVRISPLIEEEVPYQLRREHVHPLA
jgi:thiazole/oxazole-forming peptide maturase SagD family component